MAGKEEEDKEGEVEEGAEWKTKGGNQRRKEWESGK